MFVRRKKIRLHVHLLDLQLAGRDALVDPLVRRIEATRVADHADQAGLLLHLIDGLGIVPAVGERNLHLHVLAGLHALDRLLRVHLRRRAQNRGARRPAAPARRSSSRRRVRDAVLLRDFLRRCELPADDRHDFDAVDLLDRIEMLLPERAGACEHDLHRPVLQDHDGPLPCSRPARDRSGAPRATCASSAPRMISHITSSMPSEPASRMYSHVRDARERFRIGHELVEELRVELLVDEAGARALQLVAHAAGAPDLHLQIGVERIDGAADRLAELVAAIARRRRVLHDVDRERNHLARPRLRLAEHQRQRHGEAVIDVHPIDDREVEIGLDHRLRDVLGELRMPLDDRHRPRAPAFVGRLELLRAADRERRNDVEAERRRVIVVDEEDDVGRVLRHPALRELVALEQRRPVRLGRLAQVDAPRRSPARARTRRLR